MIRKLYPCLILTSMISACGSGDVKITLQTSLPAPARSLDLARTLTVPGTGSNLLVQSLNGPSCKQADLRAGFRAQGGETRWFPVELDTEILDYNTTALANNTGEATGRLNNSTPPYSVISTATSGMSAFLAIKSALKIPITIPVPKGIPGEIFIMGSLYEPVNQDHTGGTVNTPGTQCLRARTDQKPLKSFAVYGSRPFLANEAGTASLAVNVLQHVRPTGYGTPPTPYTVPSPTTPINNTADLKCRDVMNPRTCSNRGLFHVRFNLGVSTQVLIRQPLPPHPQSFSTRIHLDNGQTAQWTPTVIPKESPFLLTYLNGTKIFDVEVRYFAKEIVFSHLGVRYTLPLIECAFPGFTALAGMLPEDTGTPPSLPLCGNGSYNFAITVADAGFN